MGLKGVSDVLEKVGTLPATHPIMRSYCCCRMLEETSQSTWPDLRVMASASAMSC